MSIEEMSKSIGKEGTIVSDGMRFSVVVKDAKSAYGNLRYLVTPKAGVGQSWVNANRVLVLEAAQ